MRTQIFIGLAALMLAASAHAEAPALPAAIKEKGAVTVAIVPNYPPMEFKDPASGKLMGFDVDLATALAAKLGVKLQWQETGFEQMINALNTKRVDLIISGMSDLESRRAAVTFVDYLKSGPQFYILAKNKAAFPDMSALCGKSVGASRRTSFPSEIAAWSDAHCVKAGKPAIKVVGTEGSADARTQLREGRVDAAMQGSETLPYVMSQEPGAYAAVGAPIASQLTGIGVDKADTELAAAVATALKEMIADGTYPKILEKWGLEKDSIGTVTIDGK